MTVAAWLAAGLLTLQAGAPQSFDLRPGPAVPSINRLAAQAGVDVVITADLSGRRTPAMRGRMSPEAAFEQLPAPLGARAVRIGDGVYRIEPAPRTATPARAPSAPRAPAPPEPTTLSEVVVTAVPPVGLGDASGRNLMAPDALERIEGAGATDAIADLSATVDSTRQGLGRNKLFVRGLSDSAINGPLQATVGQYLGDLRLGYGSPDPDLALIDVQRVEVFEGPQGARFGTGSIGGVLRIRPRAPRPDERSARLIVGSGFTSGGDQSYDAAAVLNHGFGAGAAARLVAYARRDGGFLDSQDPTSSGVDGVDTIGGRAAILWTHAGWDLELSGAAQRVTADDSQTIPARTISLTRSNKVQEPYESSFALVGLTARREIGRVTLISATSVSQQGLTERFDATQTTDPFPRAVDRTQKLLSFSSEARLEFSGDHWDLSGGGSVALGETVVERRHRLLPAEATSSLAIDLTRQFAELAAFGEFAVSPAPNWRVAIGARVSTVRIESNIEDVAVQMRLGDDRPAATWRLTPSLSARWDATPAVSLFGRFEQAVRPAGVNEANGAFARYQGDRVILIEAGARTRNAWKGVSGELSVGWVDWRDVQADIVTEGGDLVTDNVGDGEIYFLSVKAAWRAHDALEISGGVFLNESTLTRTRFSTIGGGRTDIPNVAPVGAQLSIDWEAGEIAHLPLRLGADFRYVGQSRLGVGPMLDVPQGGYTRSELMARLGDDRRAVVLRISNPFDTRGIRYGIGSPYQLSEPQAVPLRPLTAKLSLDLNF